MAKIYTTDTCECYTINLQIWDAAESEYSEDYLDDLIAESAEQDGLHLIGHTFIYVAMQRTVDELIAYWQEQVDIANSGKDTEQLHALPEGQEWNLDVTEWLCYPVTKELLVSPADLEFIMQHSDQWIPEYCDELIYMADMEDEAEAEAEKDNPNYERLWYKAAEKLGIDIDCVY